MRMNAHSSSTAEKKILIKLKTNALKNFFSCFNFAKIWVNALIGVRR
jgi:hypothetical protein